MAKNTGTIKFVVLRKENKNENWTFVLNKDLQKLTNFMSGGGI